MAITDTTPLAYTPSESQASIDFKRRVAYALMQQGADTTPIKSWTQGAARALQAALGGYDMYRADQSDREDMGKTQGLVKALIGGGSSPQASTAIPNAAAPTQAADATPAAALAGSPDYGKAIASIESGGNYGALGPVTKTGDRAYGKYQIMGSNIGPWSKEALGNEVTPQAFLADPSIQDAIFKNKFGSYVNKYGPEGASKAWFAGEGGMNNPNARDQLGTSVADYGSRFMRALGPQGVQVAGPVPSPDTGAPPPQVAQQIPPQVAQAPAPQAAPQPAPAPGIDPNRAALLAALAGTRSGAPYAQGAISSLINDKPELKTLTNMMGEQVPYWADANKRTLTPAQPGGGQSPFNSLPADASKDDVLAAAEKQYPGVTNRVEQLYRGEGAMPNARQNKIDGPAMQLIQKVYPDWNMTVWGAKKKMMDQLSSGQPSSLGGRLASSQNALEHLANATDTMVKKGNYDLGTPLLSAPLNWATSQTTDQQSLKNQLDREALTYGGEKTKFLTGSEGTEAERRAFLDSIGANTMAPPAMAGTVEGEYRQIRDALMNEERNIRGVLGDAHLEKRPVITPEVKSAMQRIEKNMQLLRGGAQAGTPAPQAIDPIEQEMRRRNLLK